MDLFLHHEPSLQGRRYLQRVATWLSRIWPGCLTRLGVTTKGLTSEQKIEWTQVVKTYTTNSVTPDCTRQLCLASVTLASTVWQLCTRRNQTCSKIPSAGDTRSSGTFACYPGLRCGSLMYLVKTCFPMGIKPNLLTPCSLLFLHDVFAFNVFNLQKKIVEASLPNQLEARSSSAPHLGRAFTDAQELRQVPLGADG